MTTSTRSASREAPQIDLSIPLSPLLSANSALGSLAPLLDSDLSPELLLGSFSSDDNPSPLLFTAASSSSSSLSKLTPPQIVVTPSSQSPLQVTPLPSILTHVEPQSSTARSLADSVHFLSEQLARADHDFAAEIARIQSYLFETRAWMKDWREEQRALSKSLQEKVLYEHGSGH